MLKYIEIVFENVESIVVPIDRIKELKYGSLEDMRDNAYRTDHLLLSISYNSDSDLEYDFNEYDEPLGMFTNNPTSNSVEDRPNILGRIINHRDIVCIETLDENKVNIQTLYVPWHEEDEYDNRLMSVRKVDGWLTIEITQ